MATILMKAVISLGVLSLGAAVVQVQQDRTITQVVKLLQDMLEKSKKEGDEERVIYAKFKCYCDQSEADKKASIEELTEQISLLEAKIEETQGSTGGLSSECAELKTKMADNRDALDTATTVRNKQHKAFEAEEDDLETAIGQMNDAIKTLGAVGADQTMSAGADTKQFMAGKGASLLSLETQMHTALDAATALMTPTQASKTTAFLQAPFTGTYTSQSAQVLGILKSMRDTFEANLASARTTEKEQEDAFLKLEDILNKAHKEMSESYKSKQKDLGGNDGDLASDKKTLAVAEKKKASDEKFLSKLIPLCEDKAASYQNRKLLRANEEAAIAEAISILNSDEAFATFGTVSATSNTDKLNFLQLRSAHRRIDGTRAKTKMILQSAAKDAHSKRLSKVVSLLTADNPFETVLAEIDNMLEVIVEEGKADKENYDWCKKERKDNKADKKQKEKEMLSLEKEINKLENRINDPKDGLKAVIAETEDSLVKNRESQTTETKERLGENLAYQQDIKNLVQAESILKRAIKALTTYYDDLEAKLEAGEAAFLQEDPKPPEAWAGDKSGETRAYTGQSGKGGSKDVLGMLGFILDETIAENKAAHAAEEKAQVDYEDSMIDLKANEQSDEKLLAKTQDNLAQSEKDLLEANEDLVATTKDRDAIVDYLLKIKPGCDFIDDNFKLREKNRGIESEALRKAIRLIKRTPAYKTFDSESTVESYGDCKKPCVKNEAHVKCKACMADVTIPAYCAGHKGTPGCK
jgi:hypothetical protein